MLNRYLMGLPGAYLFAETARRAAEFRRKHPEQELLSLGIGDVPGPLVPAVTEAMGRAVEEMGTETGFRGYGPVEGYPFLRGAIARWDYRAWGMSISPEDIFISDGAKTDCGGIWELFAEGCRIGVCDPCYPVYVDTSAMAGRAGTYDAGTGRWSGLHYLPCTRENDFVPEPPKEALDVVYLCFPNNPTGTAATARQLQRWVDYANGCGAILLFDSAYEAFVTTPWVPHSIFEVRGAETCAIEFRSFSKTAGFTGTRCAYTVIPRTLERQGVKLQKLWLRRQAVRTNGVAYVVQRGAEAVYTPEGREQIRAVNAGYLQSAGILSAGLSSLGLEVYGGIDAPYLWVRTPDQTSSWAFFNLLLQNAGVIVTPGAGFGACGEGYVRLSAFLGAERARQAVDRIKRIL